MRITLQKLPYLFSVCKLNESEKALPTLVSGAEFCFYSRTDKEVSLVVKTTDAPENAVKREDGWRCFRASGVLEFSLVGVMSDLTTALAHGGISVFVVSTYDTDYIFVRREKLDEAERLLAAAGFGIEG